MIKEYYIKVNQTNIRIVKNLGYKCNKGDIIYLEKKHLNTKGFKIIFKHVCDVCGKEFESNNADSLGCSRSCVVSQIWKRDDYQQKMSEMTKKLWNDKTYREEHCKIAKELWQNDEYRNNHIEKMHKYFEDPENRKRVSEQFKEIWKDESYRKEKTDALKERWEDSKEREKTSKQFKELWADDKYRNMIIKKQTIAQNKPEQKKKISEHSKKMWKNPDYIKKQMNLWKNADFVDRALKAKFKYKEFELPSGRHIKLQGYEPQVLEQLLQTYSENDIITGVKEINKEIGKILYNFNGKERRYYPDFYIKSTNTIIEVKSTYTFELHKKKNLAKEQACLQQGFNFEFIII